MRMITADDEFQLAYRIGHLEGTVKRQAELLKKIEEQYMKEIIELELEIQKLKGKK